MLNQPQLTENTEIPPEKRKSSRAADFLPVTVSIAWNNDNAKFTEHVPGRIINISDSGACVLLSRGLTRRINDSRPFHEDTANGFQMHIRGRNYDCQKIPARPVWYETIHLDGAKIFKIGIHFCDELNKSDLM